MALATADQIRHRPIFVTIPGTDLQIECRRPDPLELIANGLLPLDLYAGVLEQLATWAETPGGASPADVAAAVRGESEKYETFTKRWVAAAAVNPRVVLTVEEADADPKALWVDELEDSVKYDIVARTFNAKRFARRVSAAVTEFRRLRSDGVGAGRDGQAVPGETVAAVAGDGSAAGA